MTEKKLKMAQKSSESLSDDAYEWLIAAITSFQLPTNSLVSENKLAAELGVSRTPIREALKRLEAEGLVKRGADGRFFVAMLTNKEVDEAIDLLMLCDVYMFQRAAKNLDNAGALVLKEAAEAMRRSAKAKDRDGWIKHDKIFHETVMRAADNEIISEVARITRQRIQRFWARSLQGAHDLETCSQEHADICLAIIGKDMNGIRKVSDDHLTHLRANMHGIVSAMAPFLGA
jgi:DNA-binding GntR family transcriptional regulator